MAQQWLTLTTHKGLDRRSLAPTGIVCECENVALEREGFLPMRAGLRTETAPASLTTAIDWLGRFVTTTGAVELWASGDSGELARNASGVWAAVTVADAMNASDTRYISAAALNGKYYVAYNSTVNRLHLWDGSTFRRVGFNGAPAAPSVATQGGAGLSFTRHYRLRYIELSGTTVVRRSEPSSSVSITITDDAGVTVTKGAAISEGETHWEVEYAAASTGPWYRAAQVAVGTTTYSDTAATISTTNLSAETGLYHPPPSAKFLLSTGARLVMAGAWETSGASGDTTPKANRVWLMPVLGTTDEGDDERVPNTTTLTYYIDVGDDAEITGLAGPLYGDIYVFKTHAIWKLVETGDATTPYRAVLVHPIFGAVDQRSIVMGIAQTGEPAIYFLQANAVKMLSAGGITHLSDAIDADLPTGNPFSRADSLLAFDTARQQLWVVKHEGAGPTTGAYDQYLYDVRTQRWTGIAHGNTSAVFRGAAMFHATNVAGNTVERLHFCTTGDLAFVSYGARNFQDRSSSFTARVRWRGMVAEGRRASIGNPVVVYRCTVADPAPTLTLTLYREDGTSRSQSKTLPSIGADYFAPGVVVFEGLESADTYVLDVRAELSHTTGFTSEYQPSIDVLQIPYKVQEPVAS